MPIQLQGHVGSVVYSLGLEGDHGAKGELQEGGVALTAKAEPEKWAWQMKGGTMIREVGAGVMHRLLAGTFRTTRMGKILEPEATGVKDHERLEL